MSSSFFGLSVGLRGLVASQLAMEVTAHNVANASTPGYSRQRANLVASDPFSYPGINSVAGQAGQLGTGVEVASITRARDAFLDLQIRKETTLGSYWDHRSAELAKSEALFPEPTGTGLGTMVSRFYTSFADLASDPSNPAARTAAIGAAQSLADNFNQIAGRLTRNVEDANYQVGQRVDEVNDLASRIAVINKQIQQVSALGQQPNDLMDARDQMLDKLSAIVPTSAIAVDNSGLINVTVNGYNLVTGDTANQIGKALDANGHIVPTWGDGTPVSLGQSQLGALVEMRDVTVPGYLKTINDLAAGIADAVNTAHTAGFDQNGNPGQALFSYTAGDAGASLRVNSAIVADPRLLAAASAPNQPGNGANAGAIADLRTASIVNGMSAADAYAGLVAGIGTDTKQANEQSSTQSAVVDSLTARRESISGVSLDEEAANLVKFQRSYQASAKVISTLDDMLDTLINKMAPR